MSGETFNGTCLIIWYRDGKLKYKIVGNEQSAEKEYQRIKDTVPMHSHAMFAVNWDEHEIMSFIGAGEDERTN